MSEERQEPGSAPGTSALHRARRHIEDPRCLGHGISLHVDEDQGGPLVVRQRAQCFEELPLHIVALGRRGGRLVRFQQLLQPLGVVDRRGLP
ncbi:hypothetical protein ABB07_19130 [Streptomyces incarnatus]|uniref:Uncharacterized protein n=1 Tax=Streptomyces incarnatus TaxID=665007 RepID=A0ABM5TM24_9ACTN|nr:hypothetical protein ABB07_19130 [Streptomyces incarnatus]